MVTGGLIRSTVCRRYGGRFINIWEGFSEGGPEWVVW